MRQKLKLSIITPGSSVEVMTDSLPLLPNIFISI